MINGVIVKKLFWRPDERGRLMEILRNDDEIFQDFGQVYLTTAYPGVVKAWHFHKEQDDLMAVIKGMMKIVLHDVRPNSPTLGETQVFYSGEHDPQVVRIPKGVYHGFMCVSEIEAFVINTVSKPYNAANPDEFRLPFDSNEIPYDWARKNG